jgi:hypothetical protein
MGFLSRPDGTTLARILGPKLSVIVTLDGIEFQHADRRLKLAPFLSVREGIVVAVGDAPSEGSECLSIYTPDPEDRAIRLGKLVLHGVKSVLARDLTVRPVVEVSMQTDALAFSELRSALLAAGAAEVKQV